MKRKIVAFMLSGLTVFALTACTGLNIGTGNIDKDTNLQNAQLTGEGTTSQTTASDNTGSDTANTDTSTDDGQTNTDSNTGNDTETANVQVSGFPNYRESSNYFKNESFTDNNGETLNKYRVEYREVLLDEGEDGDKYPFRKLADALKQTSQGTKQDLDKTVNDMKDAWKEMYPDTGDDRYFMEFYSSVSDGVERADSKVFSVLRYRTEFWGGAHDITSFAGYNYDSATGETIGFDDVFVNTDGLEDVIADYLYKYYEPDMFFAENKEGLASDIKSLIDEKSLVFIISYDGVTVIFNNYVLAPYVAGYQQVFLQADEYSKYLNQDYFKDTPSEYIVRVNTNMYYPMKFEDGYKNMGFGWAKTYNAEYGFYSDTFQTFYAYSGTFDYDQEIELSGSFMDPEVFIIRKNGKDFLYIQNHYFDGVDYLQIFEAKKKLEPLAEYSGGPTFPLSNELTEMSYYENLSFGAELLFGEAKARVNDNGTLDIDKVYNLERYREYGFSFSITKDLDVVKADANDKPSKDKATLKSGTVVYVISTDNETYWTVEDENGGRYCIEIVVKEREHYLKNGDFLPQYIEGHYDF